MKLINNSDEKIIFDKSFIKFIKVYSNIIVFSKDIFYFIEKNIIQLVINDYFNDEESSIGFLFINNDIGILKNNIFTININEEKYYNYLNEILKLKQISILITPANINEISNSLFYNKPIINFGNGIFQNNINGYINRGMSGIVIKEEEKNNYKIL